MTVGFYSPLPPARSGVAAYAAGLLAALRRLGDVKTKGGGRVDVRLYHLGNNQLHRPFYEQAMAEPGVVVLHDAVLQHFYLGSMDEAEYINEFVFNYGEWERDAATDYYRNRAASGMDWRYFTKPMLRRLAERSIAVVVHNPAAARMVLDHNPRANVVEIAHYYDCPFPPQPDARARTRIAWAADERTCVFGVFGYLRESKRLQTIVRAFVRLHAEYADTRLIVAGDFSSPDLGKAIGPLLAHSGIRVYPHLPESDFWRVADAVDCCLNLRYPSAGETSGIGVRLMGLGKAVCFTDGDEVRNLPKAGCIRISPGLEETEELFENMKITVKFPEIRRAIGMRAAAHVRDFHGLERVAGQYWKTLCAFRESSR